MTPARRGRIDVEKILRLPLTKPANGPLGTLKFFVSAAAEGRADRARINHNQSLPGTLFDTFRAEDNGLRHRRITDANENALGVLCHLSGRGANLSSGFRSKLLSLRVCIRPERNFVPGFEKIAGHRGTHEAEAEKSKFCHKSGLYTLAVYCPQENFPGGTK